MLLGNFEVLYKYILVYYYMLEKLKFLGKNYYYIVRLL